jgi:hypothetical protein
MKSSTIFGAAAVLAITCGAVPGFSQGFTSDAAPTTTTVTAATGTITHLNYDGGGEVQGFLIGTNILLTFPGNICGGLGTLGAVGNSVTYSGTAVTATSGFESVNVTSFTNTTTKATYTPPTNTATTYGPTSGTVKQLNYGNDGSTNGFVFTASGATASIFVATSPGASSTLTPLLTVGATVSVTGTTSPAMSACASSGAIEAVMASSLTIGTQTIVITGGGQGGNGGGPGPVGPGPGGHH